MALKDKAFIAVSSAVLATGMITALQPPANQREARERSIQRQVEDLSDAHEEQTRRQRQAGDDLGQAEQDRRRVPGEHRPPEPRAPRIRLR